MLSIQISDGESESPSRWDYFEEIISKPLATDKKPVPAVNLDQSILYCGLKLEEKK